MYDLNKLSLEEEQTVLWKDRQFIDNHTTEKGTAHWCTPNTDAINESRFTALPGDNCGFHGSSNGITEGSYWWTATEDSA